MLNLKRNVGGGDYYCIVLGKRKNIGLPDGPWVDKKINILANIIAFHRDNDHKLKFEKLDIFTYEVNAKKKLESNP